MENTKYHRLRSDSLVAIASNNIEKCFELLADNLDDRASAYNEYIHLRARLSETLHLWATGQTSSEEYSRTLNQIRAGLLNFINHVLKPEDVSLFRRIHDYILVIACKNSPTNWKNLFNDAYFSRVHIIHYKDIVPDEYKNPDVIVFDDLDCAMKNNVYMGRYIQEMPNAHLLYVGKENPLEEDDPAAYERCANANSKFTVHARLRELLEFRKIYGSSE